MTNNPDPVALAREALARSDSDFGWSFHPTLKALARAVLDQGERIKELEAEHSAACEFLDWCLGTHWVRAGKERAFAKWQDAHKAACPGARAALVGKPQGGTDD